MSQIGAFLFAQVTDVFGKQVDLDPRRGAVLAEIAAAAPRQRPIVRGLGHRRDHLGVDVVGKHPVEFEMIEGLLDHARGPDIGSDRVDQRPDF